MNKYRSALWASRAERAAFEATPNETTYTAYLSSMRAWTKDPNFNLSGTASGTASAAAEAVIAEQEKAAAAAAAQKDPSDVSRRTGEGDLGDPLTPGEQGDIHNQWDPGDPEPDPGGMLPEPPEPEKKPPTDDPGTIHFHPPNEEPTPEPGAPVVPPTAPTPPENTPPPPHETPAPVQPVEGTPDPEPGPGGMLPEPPEPERKPPTDPGTIHFHPPDPTPAPKPPDTGPQKKPVPDPKPIHPQNPTPPPIHRVPPRTTPASTETPAFHISETRGWKFVHSVALPEHKTLPSFMREYRDYGHTTDLAPMQAPPMLEERRGHGGGAMVHSDAAAVDEPTVPPPSHELPEDVATYGVPDSVDTTGYEREASTITGMSPEDQDVADYTNESYTDPDQRQPMLHGAKYIRTMSTMHNAVYERGNQIYVAERGTDPTSWDDIKTDGKIIVQDGAGDASKDLSVDRQGMVLEQFDRVRRAYPNAHITLGGHSLANNLISHVLLNRDDRNVHAIGFNGLPHRQFNETHHKDVRYKHFHSRYDPVSYDPAANEQQTMPNNTISPYYMKTGLSPHSMTHFMRESDRKRSEENIQKYATTSDSWFTRLKKAVATAVDDEPEPDEHGML